VVQVINLAQRRGYLLYARHSQAIPTKSSQINVDTEWDLIDIRDTTEKVIMALGSTLGYNNSARDIWQE